MRGDFFVCWIASVVIGVIAAGSFHLAFWPAAGIGAIAFIGFGAISSIVAADNAQHRR